MKLRELRLSKLLTVDELGKKTGLSPSTIRAIEKACELPSIKTARKLTEVFEVEPEDIDEVRAAILRASNKENPVNGN